MQRSQKGGLGRAFGNVFAANLSSSLGDGIYRIAGPLLAVRLTDDPLLISGIAALAMLPWLLFAIPAGILIDRIDRRHALAFASGVRTLLAVALVVLVATGALTIWWLYLIVFAYGVFETVYDGAARAVVPSVVQRADLHRANSRIEAGELVVQNFIAAPITSVLFAVAVLIPLGVNAVMFGVALVLALFLPAAAAGEHRTNPDDAPPVPWYRQLKDGWRFIMANRMLRTLWFLSTFIGICFSAGVSIWVLFVLERIGVPEAWFGVFTLTGAVGGILGSMAVGPFKERFGTGLTMSIANVGCGVTILVAGLWPNVWVAGAMMALSSATVTIWNVLMMSLRQSIIPSRIFGRVQGTWRTLLWGSMPLGSLIGGMLGRIDLTTPLIVSGACAALAAVIYFRFVARLPNPEDVDNGDAAPSVSGTPGVPVHDQ